MTTRLLIGLALTILSAAWRPISAQEEVEQMGSWYYQASLDPITDVNSSNSFTMDDDEKWVLGINCMEGDYWAGIMVHPSSLNGSLLRLQMLTETWKRTMTWRIDQTEPVTQNWLTAKSGLAIRNEGAAQLVEALTLANNRVVLRFGHSAATYTVVLSVDGAAEAIAALNGCN